MRFARWIALMAGCVFSVNSFAWDAMGHGLVAEVAYANLNPDAKAKVDELVGYMHKDYYYENSFRQLAAWPDELHSQKIEVYTHWHYINLPFSTDGTALENPDANDNVIWAINSIIPVLKDSKGNPYEKARFLSFLAHFVGDIHQPLHTVSRFSVAHPDGDKGGNLYNIHFPQGMPMDQDVAKASHSLHKFWDQGLGLWSKEKDEPQALAKTIMSKYPQAYFGKRMNELNPSIWSQEGFNLAENVVYATPENEEPSSTYVAKGQALVEEQIALAGYRLAAILNNIWP